MTVFIRNFSTNCKAFIERQKMEVQTGLHWKPDQLVLYSHIMTIFSHILNSYFYSSEVAKTFCIKLSGLCIGLLPHSKSKLYAKNL